MADVFTPYVPEAQIARQYSLADALRNQPQARSFAGVLAQGLGAVGGNLVQGSANNALQANQALRTQAVQNIGSATDLPSFEKAAIGSQVPEIQNLGLQAKVKQLGDDPNKEYRVRAAQALQQGMKAGTPEFRDYVLTGKIAGMNIGNRFGLNPIYGTDANGNPVVMQLNTSGGIEPAKIPEGVKISKTPIKMDAGTHWVLLDPITRQAIGTVPKDVAGAASQKEQGTAQGKATVNLPIVENASQRMLDQIDKLLADPGLSRVTGTLYGRLPEITNVSKGAKEAQSRIDQILGDTFLQAYNDLRGGGQITEAEGSAAKAAYNRLQHQELGTPEYIEALKEFRAQIIKLRDIARARAQGGDVVGASQGEPQTLPPGWSIQKVQ